MGADGWLFFPGLPTTLRLQADIPAVPVGLTIRWRTSSICFLNEICSGNAIGLAESNWHVTC